MEASLARPPAKANKLLPTVVPMNAPLGAQIEGADIAAGIDEPAMDVIRKAISDYSVIVLRDQHISPQQQTDFSKRFGEMRVSFYNRYGVPDHPELTTVSNIKDESGKDIGIADAGMLWHSDASYLPQPDMYTLLYAVEVPHENGKPLGDTSFTNCWTAYDDLPHPLKDRLKDMKAVHSFVHHLAKKAAKGQLKRDPLTPEQKAALPDVEHPIVRTHPVNGRLCLYVTDGHTASIVGLPQAESDALLEELRQHIQQPRYHYRHSWRVGDVVIWDNAALQHLAHFDYGTIPRKLWRSGILGPVPV
jgi:taurine dioxygenase